MKKYLLSSLAAFSCLSVMAVASTDQVRVIRVTDPDLAVRTSAELGNPDFSNLVTDVKVPSHFTITPPCVNQTPQYQ